MKLGSGKGGVRYQEVAKMENKVGGQAKIGLE